VSVVGVGALGAATAAGVVATMGGDGFFARSLGVRDAAGDADTDGHGCFCGIVGAGAVVRSVAHGVSCLGLGVVKCVR
jgi:hypothetical protein